MRDTLAVADAVASLSDEQRRFCAAFRAAQLQSTLLGVLVLQIKPQLEARALSLSNGASCSVLTDSYRPRFLCQVLLGLPPDALTKEIELTQDLTELFVKFQISADLLSYAGPTDGDGPFRVAAVKGHVKAIRSLIDASEERAVAARAREAAHDNPLLLLGSGGGEGGGYGGPSPMFDSASMAPSSMPPPMPAPCSAPSAGASFGGGAITFNKHRLAPRRATSSAPIVSRSVCAPPPPPPPPSQPAQQARATPPLLSAAVTPSTTAATAADDDENDGGGVSGAAGAGVVGGGGANVACQRELTSLPRDLDAAYSSLDPDSRLRPVVITPGGPWVRASYASLLSRTAIETALDAASQASLRSAAFDLVDALSRSGALPLRHAALHVLVGAAHGFDSSLVDTLTRDNINPIEKVERSLLIVASTLTGKPPAELVRGAHAARIAAHSPALFAAAEGATASLTAQSAPAA